VGVIVFGNTLSLKQHFASRLALSAKIRHDWKVMIKANTLAF